MRWHTPCRLYELLDIFNVITRQLPAEERNARVNRLRRLELRFFSGYVRSQPRLNEAADPGGAQTFQEPAARLLDIVLGIAEESHGLSPERDVG
jgi:hypothetical protein